MLLGLALILRIPMAFLNLEILNEQVLWLALSERFTEGSRLYSEIWTSHPPIFSWINSLVYFLLGGSVLAQVFASTVFVWISSLLFNSLLSRIEAFKSKSYVPGAMFILLSCTSFEFYSLSPQLVATPFLLLSLGFSLPLLRSEASFDRLFFSGLFFSFSSAIYIQTIYILPFYLLFLLLGASAKPNQIVWWLTSFIFFWLILASNYWLKSESWFFFDSMAYALGEVFTRSFWELRIYFAIFSPILFLLIIAVMNLLFRMRFLNYHVRIQRSFLALSLFILLSIPFQRTLSFYGFYFLTIPIAYFLSQYFLELKRSFWNEFIFMVLFFLAMFLNVSLINESLIFQGIASDRMSYSRAEPKEEGKKIMVFGDPSIRLRGNHLSGPILNWEYSKRKLDRFDKDQRIAVIHGFIEAGSPDLIYDPHGIFEGIINENPLLKSAYTKESRNRFFRDK